VVRPGSRAAFGTVVNNRGLVLADCPWCHEQHQHMPADGSVQVCANLSGRKYVVLVPLAELERLS
jgi:hypothetical protein